jgi:hypothetical protein
MQGACERIEIAHLSDRKHDKKTLSIITQKAIGDYYWNKSKLPSLPSQSVMQRGCSCQKPG